jgi:hypothetical protein
LKVSFCCDVRLRCALGGGICSSAVGAVDPLDQLALLRLARNDGRKTTIQRLDRLLRRSSRSSAFRWFASWPWQ